MTDAGHLCFTMKVVQGETLLDLMRAYPMPNERALWDHLDVLLRVCDALAFAHNAGVIHCDIKPENIMVGPFGEVYLMDWGIAKEQSGPSEVEAVKLLGTPAYMSPEQARGERDALGARSDIFSLGAVLYQLLTGEVPYPGPNTAVRLMRASECNYRAPSAMRPDWRTPPALEAIVLKAMAAKPEDRYQSALELKAALVQAIRGGQFPEREVQQGECIIRQGERGDEAYLILQGSFRAFVGDEHVRLMKVGEIFGEMAILGDGYRTASVIAVEPSRVAIIGGDALQHELEGLKSWLGTLVRALAQRFKERERRA